MWSLDVDNIPHPHLSLESSDNAPSSNVHPPSDSLGSSAVVVGDDLCRRHEHYYFADDNIIFQVENTRYKIHRYFFQRDSEIFASIFTLPAGPGQGSPEYNTIRLVGVTVCDFDLFLSMLYPVQIGVYAATTVSEWTSVLDLAAKWKFKSIKTLAIERLANLASPIDKIVLGRKHHVLDWLTDAYRLVCQRPEALTLEEANRLRLEDVVTISSLRQDIRSGGRHNLPPMDVSSDVISKAFGLSDSPEVLYSFEAPRSYVGSPISMKGDCSEMVAQLPPTPAEDHFLDRTMNFPSDGKDAMTPDEEKQPDKGWNFSWSQPAAVSVDACTVPESQGVDEPKVGFVLDGQGIDDWGFPIKRGKKKKKVAPRQSLWD